MRAEVTAFLAAVLVSTQGAAQSTATGPVCELHVFPSDNVFLSTKLWPDGAVAGLLEGKAPSQAVILRDLPPATQLNALKAAIERSPQFAGWVVYPESRAVNYKSATKHASRLSASRANCYAEFAVTQLVYTSNALVSKRIGAMSVLREFGATGTKPRITKIGGASKLSLYPSKDAASADVARAELAKSLEVSFQESIAKFVKKVEPVRP